MELRRLKQSQAAGELTETHVKENGKWEISLPKTEIHTLEELLAHCEVDASIWEVERFVVNKWEVGAKLGPADAHYIKVTPLFQVKATLKRRAPEAIAARDEISALKVDAAAHMPRKFPTFARVGSSGLMLEPSIYDLHIGKLAWARETGHGNYDSKIARACFDRALETILFRTSQYKFERIAYVIGNDLIHTDSKSNQTFAGTPQDTDSRYFKCCELARRMQCDAIETLLQLAPVDVYMIPGNHDPMTVWHLGDSLECWFKNAKHVRIDNSPVKRKYSEFGKVMLCWTHGETEKHSDLAYLMSTEQCEMWGRTRYREAHVGHYHTERFDTKRVRTDVRNERGLSEVHGTKVRVIPSLAPPDAWHSAKGYVGNLRSAEAFVWDKSEGLISTVMHTETESQAA